jgi:hypothetical protein
VSGRDRHLRESRAELVELSLRLTQAFARIPTDPAAVDEASELIAEFHEAEGGEPDLLLKDQGLLVLIALFKRWVRRAARLGLIGPGEAQGFLLVAILFEAVESTLWELKGLPGRPPRVPDLPDPPDDEEEPHPERIVELLWAEIRAARRDA